MGVSSPHVVLVSVLGFLNDELSIKEHEAAHDEQPQVHVSLRRTQEDSVENEGRDPGEYGGMMATVIGCYLEEEEGSKEDVDEGHEEQEGQAGHQRSFGETTSVSPSV